MSSIGALALALLAGTPALTVHVEGTAQRRSTPGCLFSIRAPVVAGGRQVTCLTSVRGYPSARAVIRSRGRMSFVLPRGTLRARVAIVQRFGPDGVHARQALTGTITGGSTLVDTRRGLRGLHLVYTLALER